MANVSNKLVDTGIKSAKPQKKPYKLFDGEGMFLQVMPTGGKYWRLKYRLAGKEKLLALGVYPEVGLAAARAKRTEARKLLAKNIDPSLRKKELIRNERIMAANTFESIAVEWHEQQKHKWKASHAKRVLTSLELNVFPGIGHRPIAEITAAELLDVLRIMEKRGALDLLARVLQRCSGVFRYAIVSQRTRTNPAADLKGALKAPQRQHYSALSAKDLPEFLKKLEQFEGYKTTKLAIKLLMLTFVRTGELRTARWEEFDIPNRIWRIPADRMKMGVEHLVPLSDQSIEILERLQELTGAYSLLFPGRSQADVPMSNNTILYGIYRMGYGGKATGHGFRTTASTVLNELGYDSDAIERQLAHGEKDKVRAAYNRAKYMDKRKAMMQTWADFVEGKNKSEVVVPLRALYQTGE